mmetsp:Transcript_33176/g.72353  ORF Transcript_33176/g.72353 Transcript_33176/m.72353 type:complete len:206 (-) Transcript_33176:178-795(-)
MDSEKKRKRMGSVSFLSCSAKETSFSFSLPSATCPALRLQLPMRCPESHTAMSWPACRRRTSDIHRTVGTCRACRHIPRMDSVRRQGMALDIHRREQHRRPQQEGHHRSHRGHRGQACRTAPWLQQEEELLQAVGLCSRSLARRQFYIFAQGSIPAALCRRPGGSPGCGACHAEYIALGGRYRGPSPQPCTRSLPCTRSAQCCPP